MKKERIVRIQDLVGLINALYPPAFAEEWDNVGLQAGDPSAQLSRVLICLDPGPKSIEAARTVGAQAILSHHPLIFRPLKNITPCDETGRVLFAAIREGIAVISAHTNLDRAPGGLNDWLAARLGLVHTAPLAFAGGGDLLKLVVFVPTGYENQVADALFSAGAGKIGHYDSCAFRSRGTGSFRPGADTSPFIGRQGEVEAVAEIRLETIVPRELVNRVVGKMQKIHPYEEVAYDLIPLGNRRPDLGLGRVGRLPEPVTLGEFARQVKAALGVRFLRLVGDAETRVAKVALCGGSGASLIADAARQGADVLVTGDVKYHDAQNALSQGLTLIDAGHFATEQLMVAELAQTLRSAAQQRGLDIEFVKMEGEVDPFDTV